jgi:hypothetical protein
MRSAPKEEVTKTTEKETARAQTKKNSGHRRTASQAPNDAVRDEEEETNRVMGGVPKEVWVR